MRATGVAAVTLKGYPHRLSEKAFPEKGYSHLNKRGTPLAENRDNLRPSWEGYPRFLTKGVPLLFNLPLKNSQISVHPV